MIKRNKSKWLLLVALSLLVIVLQGCTKEKSGKTGQPKEVNIGILRVPNDETVARAKQFYDPYFKEKGIKTNFVVFDSGVDANKAFSSGSIDFATMGHTNGVVALANQLPVKLIWINEVIGTNEQLVVRNASGVKQIDQLAGKKIATPFSSTSHFSLLNTLEKYHLTDKVTLLDMNTLDIVAAWKRGDIDAAYTWQPTLDQLLEDGTSLLSSADLAKDGYVTANITLGRDGFLEKYPDLTRDFLRANLEGGNFYRKDAETAADLAAKELDITKAEALKQMEGTLWLSGEELLSDKYLGTSEKPGDFAKVFSQTAIFLHKQQTIQQEPTMEKINQFIQPLYIEQAMKEMK